MGIEQAIVEKAVNCGASIAGIADTAALRASAAHVIYRKMENYDGIGTVKNEEKLPDEQLFQWPDSAKSVLVIGLSHPKNQPSMDWWDGRGTPGNRRMIEIVKQIRRVIEDDLGIITRPLHYYVEKGGVFLKDAAVLAGLGCIGKNNLLLTPRYGPRIRLRALFLEAELAPTGPIPFDPCAECPVYCRRVCPQHAMDEKEPGFDLIDLSVALPSRDGFYSRGHCNRQMLKDVFDSESVTGDDKTPIKYCRRCEFACPVGVNPKVA